MSEKLPGTIHSPEIFNDNLPANFDGVFDWSWTNGCFGETKITPMDFDFVVERNGNFLLFETKKDSFDINKYVNGTPKKGQVITYEKAYSLGCFTILFIQGKQPPKKIIRWSQPGFKEGFKNPQCYTITDLQKAKDYVSNWYEFANNNRFKSVDIDFLNRKIINLNCVVSKAKKNAEKLVIDLGGTVTW